MNIKELFHLIAVDKRRVKNFYYLKLLFPHPDSYIFWFRLDSYFYRKNIVLRMIGLPFALIHYICSLLLGIQIPSGTKVGGGISIKHYSCIVIARDCIIGNNCTIHQGVTLGRSFGGNKSGCPHLGNNVIVFPGAKIVGRVNIGDNVIIGANAVVISDIPNNCIVVGVPARVVSRDSQNAIKKSSYFYFGLSNSRISKVSLED